MFPYADENPAPGRHEESILLAVAMGVVFYLTLGDEAVAKYAFIPELAFAPKEFHRWVTSLFMHAGFIHILGNLWALWIFTDNVAARLGRWFFPFYLAGGLASSALDVAIRPHSSIPAVGASGAICAVIGLYIVLFPNARMLCFMPLMGGRYGYRRYGGYGGGSATFTVSALVFGAFYVGYQFLGLATHDPYRGGVGYAAHLGGLLFGAALGLLMRASPEGFQQLSGAEGTRPGPTTGPGIVDAIEAGQEELSVQRFVAESRRNPYLELPEAHQLAIADTLASYGYPQLAKTALDRFLIRHPASPARPHALLLLGWVLQSSFKEFEAAAAAYAEAAEHPAASAETKADAQKRLKEAKGILEAVSHGPAEPGEKHFLVLESATPLSDAQRRYIASIAGPDAAEAAAAGHGILLKGVEAAAAAHAAQGLEAAGVPVVVLPQRLTIALPAPQAVEGVSGAGGALTLTFGQGRERTLAWGECLLIAVVGVPLGDFARRRPGLFDLGGTVRTDRPGWGTGYDESSLGVPVEYEGKPRVVPCLEIVGGRPLERWRWMVPDDPDDPGGVEARFYAAVQNLLIEAVQVPLNAGALAALESALPDACRFEDLARAEAYMAWQLQLARLKKEKSYA